MPPKVDGRRRKYYQGEDGSDAMDDDYCGELIEREEYKLRVLRGDLPPPEKGTEMYKIWWNRPALRKLE